MKKALVKDVVEKLNSLTLTAYDFPSTGYVRVIQQAGSILFYEPAFALFWEGWYLVYTEHDGYHFYDSDDATVDSFKRIFKNKKFEDFKHHSKSIEYLNKLKKL